MSRKVYLFFLVFCWVFAAMAQGPGPDTGNPLPDSSKITLLKLVNAARTRGYRCGNQQMPPVAPLEWNDLLQDAATQHSRDMSAHNFLSHTGSDGSKFSARITRSGYTWNRCGENIAHGYPNERQVVEGWLKSPDHCKNIMNREFQSMGVARSGLYWTQDFGSQPPQK